MFILVCLITSLGTVCHGEESATRKFMATTVSNLFFSSSGDYRQVYGQMAFMPEVKIIGQVYKDFTAWGSFSFIGKDGFIEEVEEKAHISQTMFALGIGYVHKFTSLLRIRGELGITSISFKEEALDETFKGSGLGWKIGANLDYFIGKKLFATLTAAFSQASDEGQAGKIELGGFQARAGIGFAF